MASDNEKKLADQIKLLTEERKKIEQEILVLKNQIESTEKKSVANLEKIIKLETLRLDSVEKEEDIRKKIEKIDKDTEKRTEKAQKAQDQTTKGLEGQVDLTADFTKKMATGRDLLDAFSKTSFKTQAILSTLPESAKQNAANMGLTVNISEKFVKHLEKGGIGARNLATYTDEFKHELAETVDLASDVEQLESAMVKSSADAAKGKASIVDTDKTREALLVRMYEVENGNNGLTREEKKLQLDALDILLKKVDQLDVVNEKIKEQNDSAAKLNSISSKVGDTMGGWIHKLPGGDNISKILNIDKTAENVNKKMSTAFTSALGAIKGKNSPAEAFKDAGAALGSMISMAPKLMAGLGLGLLTGAVNFLMGAFGEIDQQVSDIGKEFGYSRKEAIALRDTSIDIAGEMGVVGVNSKEVVKSIGQVSDMMGGLDIGARLASGNPAAKQLVKDTALLTEKFQMSAEEVKSMSDLSTLTGKSMGELAGTAAKMGNGIMTSKQAMKALATVPKEVAVAFKGIPAQLAAAAQKAKLLGHDLKKVQDIGDGMLDIESSLQKEMEARAITGKNIQLDKARELALNGDIAGLQDELLKQAGGLGDFQKMNRLQQKSMADAMGMSVDEMTNMLVNADKLQKMGVSQKKLDELHAKSAEELRAMSKEDMNEAMKNEIEKMAKEKESAAIKERMSNIVTKLQEKLSKLLSPILEMVHGMLDAAEAGGDFDNIVESVSGVIKGIIPIMKTVFGIFSSLIGPITSIFDFITNIGSSTVQVKDAAGNLTGQVETVKSSFGGVLGVVTAIGGLFAGKALLGKGLDMLKEKAADFGKTLMSKVGGAASKVAGKITGKMGGFAGKALGKLGGKGAAAGGDATSELLEKQTDNLGKTDKMAGKAQSMGKKIADFGKGLGSALKSIGQGIGGAIQGVFEGLAKGLEALGRGLATMTPIGPVVAVVSLFFIALGAALWLAAPAIKAVAPILMKFADVLGGAFAKLIEGLAPVFTAIGAFIKGLIPVLMTIVQVLGKVFIEAIKQIPAIIKSIFEGISGIVTSIGGVIVSVINAIGDNIVKIIDKLMSLANLDPTKLFAIATGIGALGAALVAFGGGSGVGAIADGLGNALGGLLGGDSPLSQLQTIMKDIQPEKLSGIAKAIVELSGAMTMLSNTLQNVNFDKLEEVMSAVDKASGGSKIGSIVSSIGSFFGGGGDETKSAPATAGGMKTEGQTTGGIGIAAPGGGGGTGLSQPGGGAGGDSAGLEKKMDQLISIISSMASTPTIIKIGDRTVEEINSKADFKKAYQIGIDNSYGKSLQ